MALAVLSLTGAASLLMIWTLLVDVRYAFHDGDPVELGEIAGVAPEQESNRFVRAQVSLDTSKVVRYQRYTDSDEFVLAAAKSKPALWVEYRVPPSMRGPRFVPPRHVLGRLVRASDLGARHGGLASALSRVSGASTEELWVLLDGDDPQSTGWTVGLVALLFGFFAWSSLSALWILRRVRLRSI